MNTDKSNEAMPDPTRKSSTNLSHYRLQEKAIAEGVRRMEDIIKGQTTGLTEGQFREALGRACRIGFTPRFCTTVAV